MYDEYVYLLDLCIFSYQLHAQTLIWPLDPYYEQWKESTGAEERRQVFMRELRSHLAQRTVPVWRGPGQCSNKKTNDLLDPIISNYNRIIPWLPSFTRPDLAADGWVVYNTPREIKDRINHVYIVSDDGQNIDRPAFQSAPTYIHGASDLLFCFEGGTGAVGITGDSATRAGDIDPGWSIMGFVLARTITDVDIKRQNPTGQAVGYDIYIVFRGSRSGLLRLGEARKEKAGNPDWVTDLELLRFISDPDINPQGSAARGFRTSIKQTLPNVLTCLREIHRLKNGPPRSIYVTGHSLGGALAVDFASAVLLGTRYGPDGLGQSMPDEIKIWPWRATRVMTFGSPAVGDVNFQKAFDEVVLCNRVWVYKDVVTLQFSDSVVGLPLPGSVVGEGHHLKPGIGHNVGPMEAHDPRFIRRFLVRHRKSKGADLTGTPANTGKEELSEPWKVFDSCLGAFNHMKAALDSYVLNTPSFKDLVLAFDVECARYVWAVEDALAALKDPQLQQKLQILSELWKYFHDPDPDPTAPPAMRILKLHTLWDDVAKANLLPDYKGSTENGVKSRFSRFVGLLLFTSAVGRDPGLLKHMSTSGGPEKLAFMNLVNSKF